MADEDFQRLLRALVSLLPAQLVALDAAVRGQMAAVSRPASKAAIAAPTA